MSMAFPLMHADELFALDLGYKTKRDLKELIMFPLPSSKTSHPFPSSIRTTPNLHL